MNYADMTMLVSLVLFSGIVSYVIGFSMGSRSAYVDVNQNLGNSKEDDLLEKSVLLENEDIWFR